MALVWIKDAERVWSQAQLYDSKPKEALEPTQTKDTITQGEACEQHQVNGKSASYSCSILPRLDTGEASALQNKEQDLPIHNKNDIDTVYLPCSGRDESHLDDFTNLLYIHEASILHNLEQRFLKKQPYTFISRVLLSVNPITEIDEPVDLVGSQDALKRPHPYSVAEHAFQQMERESRSQCVVVSGESGSGKTETSKRVIRHIVMRTGKSCFVDEQLLAASPILEAFGNAQTVSNGNSSRFGKFVNLYFDNKTNSFRRAAIKSYLLERSRVVTFDYNERSFHIFYQILAGADDELRAALLLDQYTGPYSTNVRESRDKVDFLRLAESMKLFGISAEKSQDVFAVVAAILHLAGINFINTDSAEGNIAHIAHFSRPSLRAAAILLGVDENELLRLICEKTMVLRGETMVSQRTAEAATQARDALAKALYQRLFDWILGQINHVLGNPQALGAIERGSVDRFQQQEKDHDQATSRTENGILSTEETFIGILDIFGFESFEKNSFEQLLINFANEALQTIFNEQLFQAELDLYRAENLDIGDMNNPPNNKCVDCLALFRTVRKSDLQQEECLNTPGAPSLSPISVPSPSALQPSWSNSVNSVSTKSERIPGLLAALNTISVGPEPTDKKLIAYLHRNFQGRPCYIDPHPRLAACTFIIDHYAGQVSYTIHGFVEKNSDSLPPEADAFFAAQTNGSKIIKSMFASTGNDEETHGMPNRASLRQKVSSKKSKSIAATFEEQIRSLMNVIDETQCSFVRCIKPNAALNPACGFDPKYVSRQLSCLSIPQTAQLLQAGLPGRLSYSVLHQTFGPMLRAELPAQLLERVTSDPLYEQIAIKCILRSLGANDSQCKFGKTRIFFANGVLAMLDAKFKAIEAGTESIPNTLVVDIERACAVRAARSILIRVGALRRRRLCQQRRTALQSHVSTVLQAHVRRKLAQRAFARKINAIITIQRIWRTHAKHVACVTKIQAFFRGRIQRQKFMCVCRAVRTLQRAWQLRADLFIYSSSENGTVYTVSTDSELGDDWHTRIAEADLHHEEYFCSSSSSINLYKVNDDELMHLHQHLQQRPCQDSHAGGVPLSSGSNDTTRQLESNSRGCTSIGTHLVGNQQRLPDVCEEEASDIETYSFRQQDVAVGQQILQGISSQGKVYTTSEQHSRNVEMETKQSEEEIERDNGGNNGDDEDSEALVPDAGVVLNHLGEDEDIYDSDANGYHADDDGNYVDEDDEEEDEQQREESEGKTGANDDRTGVSRNGCSSETSLGGPLSMSNVDRTGEGARPPQQSKGSRDRNNNSKMQKLRPFSGGEQVVLSIADVASDANSGNHLRTKRLHSRNSISRQRDSIQGSNIDEKAFENSYAGANRPISRQRGSVELLRKDAKREGPVPATGTNMTTSEDQKRRPTNSNDELTTMLMKLSLSDNSSSKRGPFSSSKLRNSKESSTTSSSSGTSSFADTIKGLQAQEGTFAQIVDDYNAKSLGKGKGKKQKDPSRKRSSRKFKFPAMFSLKHREERVVLRKLKSGMRKKHYRQVIEALVRARELGLNAPEVLAAEHMIYRVKTLHAQQILREAMVIKEIEPLTYAIEQAIRFGMGRDDPQGLLRDAKEMLSALNAKQQRRSNRRKSQSLSVGQTLASPARKKTPGTSNAHTPSYATTS